MFVLSFVLGIVMLVVSVVKLRIGVFGDCFEMRNSVRWYKIVWCKVI